MVKIQVAFPTGSRLKASGDTAFIYHLLDRDHLKVQMSVKYFETYYLEKSLTDAYTYESGRQDVT